MVPTSLADRLVLDRAAAGPSADFASSVTPSTTLAGRWVHGAAVDLEAPGPPLLTDARAAVERVVDYLARQEGVPQRKAQEALRRHR
jgi:hypothetical protein